MMTSLPALAVNFTWANVGDAGNSQDPNIGGGSHGIGVVTTSYRIATLEVNLSQYTEFLNSVDPNGFNFSGLYNIAMAQDANVAGIGYDGNALAGTKYNVLGSGLRPVSYVSWNDAARFANWMHNGQGNGSTETGAYNMFLGIPVRAPNAKYFIPSENEWHKAAYYDPSATGPTSDYWLFPTRSDSPAGNTIGVANSANFINGGISAKVENGLPSELTIGGAYANSASHYGTFDQGGNVNEWTETTIDDFDGTKRVFRGGAWNGSASGMYSLDRRATIPTLERNHIGFRIASIPEPSSAALLLLASGACLLRRQRPGSI